jgi:hypothetical protein
MSHNVRTWPLLCVQRGRLSSQRLRQPKIVGIFWNTRPVTQPDDASRSSSSPGSASENDIGLPDALVGLARADQYDTQKRQWQERTQRWRAEVIESLQQLRAVTRRQEEANEEIREQIRDTVSRAANPALLTVADLPPLAEQWADPSDASRVGARDGKARLWRCTVEPAHGTWPAPPKDRSRRDRPSMCPNCSGSAPRPGELPPVERSLAAIPALAAELHPDSGRPEQISYGNKSPVLWAHKVPAVRRGTGEWYLATHVWEQPPKNRTNVRYQDGRTVGVNGCPICNSDKADASNSLAAWYPELAAQWLAAAAGRTPENTSVGSKVQVTWRCLADERHATWPATINNRTAKENRSGCPSCSKNISAKQIALYYELKQHLPELELEAPVPLNPEPGQRYRGVRVDMWDETIHLVIEFDGWKHHGSTGWRERTPDDLRKTQRLTEAGETVIRVREDLEPIGPHDVVVGAGWNSWKVAVAVLKRVDQLGLHRLPDLAGYLTRGSEAAAADTERALLGERYVPRKMPKVEKSPRPPKEILATPPHPNSRLTPAGPPYANPKPRAGALRDYDCSCGGKLTGVSQADVSRGNTLSCGCVAQEARRTPRSIPDRSITSAARKWARERGIPVNDEGPLNAQILASYKLAMALPGSYSDSAGLIPEVDVKAWMASNYVEALSRGRTPSSAWHGYAEYRIVSAP